MTAEKISAVQQFFKAVKRHVAAVKLLTAMNPQLPLTDFSIRDLRDVNLRLPFERADQNSLRRRIVNPRECFVQNTEQLFGLQRFQQVAECFDLIALDCELLHRRDKNQTDIGILFSNQTACFNPVQLIHLNVHQQQIVLMLKVFQQSPAVRIEINFRPTSTLPQISAELIAVMAGRFYLIFDNRDMVHFVLHRLDSHFALHPSGAF